MCVLATFAPGANASAATTSDRESALLAEINEVRRAHGLRPLRLDPKLRRAARAHSVDMIRRTYFAHGDTLERLRRFRVRAPVVGANLAWGAGEEGRAQAIVRAWLGSPGHRRTLLHSAFLRVGVGAVEGPFQGFGDATVVTADFAGS